MDGTWSDSSSWPGAACRSARSIGSWWRRSRHRWRRRSSTSGTRRTRPRADGSSRPGPGRRDCRGSAAEGTCAPVAYDITAWAIAGSLLLLALPLHLLPALLAGLLVYELVHVVAP